MLSIDKLLAKRARSQGEPYQPAPSKVVTSLGNETGGCAKAPSHAGPRNLGACFSPRNADVCFSMLHTTNGAAETHDPSFPSHILWTKTVHGTGSNSCR
jgi:hypothetical protein